jgi:hypothetical protein
MADAGRFQFDQHFAGARARKVDFFDGQGRAGAPGNGCFGFHGSVFR